MNTRILLLVGFSYFVGLCVQSQVTFEWVQRASLPAQGRWGAFNFEINGFGYVAGGNAGGSYMSDVWRYDPVADAWTQVANMPQGRSHGTSWSLNGKGYVMCGHLGGSFYSNSLWEYDPIMDQWSIKAALPADMRYGSHGFAINGFGYVGGGNIGSATGPYLDDLWKYDAANDQWSSSNGIPGEARYGSTGFTTNGKGYVHGGRDATLAFTTELWEFDPQTEQWSNVQSMPGPGRSWMMVMPFANDAVVAGGANNGVITYQAYNYTPANDTWDPIPDYPGGSGWSGASFRLFGRPFGGLGWTIAPTDEHHNDWWELVKVDPNSIDDRDPSISQLIVVPNPVGRSGQFELKLPNGIPAQAEVELFDPTGRSVLRCRYARTISADAINPGIYSIQITDQGELIARGRAVIE